MSQRHALDALDPEALRILVEVVRLGSFTEAADRLNYTQSGISRRIAGLEHAAGGPLFERRARGVRPTPAGLALHRHAVLVLAQLAEADEELAAIREGRGGRLRVGAFPTANVDLVPRAIRAYAKTNPGIELTVAEGLSERLLTELEAGELDLAVISDYPAGLPTAETIELVHLLDDPFRVAIAAAHPLADKEILSLEDLAGEPWIQAAPRGMPTRLSEAYAKTGVTPIQGPRIADWTGKFGFVLAGLGVTLLPASAAKSVPDGIALRDLADDLPPRRIHAALPANPLAAAREFAGAMAR